MVASVRTALEADGFLPSGSYEADVSAKILGPLLASCIRLAHLRSTWITIKGEVLTWANRPMIPRGCRAVGQRSELMSITTPKPVRVHDRFPDPLGGSRKNLIKRA